MSVIATSFGEIFLGSSCWGNILERPSWDTYSCSFPQLQKSQYIYLDGIRWVTWGSLPSYWLWDSQKLV